MWRNNPVHYGLMVVYSSLTITLPHYHHYADLSKGIEGIECVSKIRSVLSTNFHAIYRAVCIQLTHFYFDDCENTCTWSYYHHQIGSMTHLPLFRVRSWQNGMSCMSLFLSLRTNMTKMPQTTWIYSRNLPKTYSKTIPCGPCDDNLVLV